MRAPGFDAVRDRVREARADRTFRRRAKPEAEPDPEAPRHVVCIVVDALRADAVTPERTPFLASLSPSSAVAPSTWTFPSITSLFTGTYPHRHDAMRASDGFEISVADMTPLPEAVDRDRQLLGDRLAGAGYDTFGAFGMIVPFLALRGHFATHELHGGADAEELLDAHEAWLRDRREQRTFSYVHLADAHEPLDPPGAFWEAHDVDPSIPGIRTWRFEDVVHETPTVERYQRHRRRLYEATVEHLDHRIGAHRARLEHLLDGEVLFVVTADHGEGFWEHPRFTARTFADPRPAYGVGHGGVPYEAITRVPLAIDGVGLDGDERASLVDLAPTLLDALDLPGPEVMDGRPLQADGAPRSLLVEATRYGHETKAVYGDRWKLVVSPRDDACFAVDLEDPDPPQVAPAERHRALVADLPDWPKGEQRRSAPRAVERRLADLGYM